MNHALALTNIRMNSCIKLKCTQISWTNRPSCYTECILPQGSLFVILTCSEGTPFNERLALQIRACLITYRVKFNDSDYSDYEMIKRFENTAQRRRMPNK